MAGFWHSFYNYNGRINWIGGVNINSLKHLNLAFKSYYKSYFKLVSGEFNAWLLGIEEDTPIPHEINLLTLVVFKTSNLYSISYSGHEKKVLKRMHSGFYYPLEGQFFFSKYLMSINFLSKSEIMKRRFVINLLKDLLEEFLKLEGSEFLKNKRLAVGFAFNKPIIIKQ